MMNLWLIFRLRDFISNETINNYVYCMYMRELHIYNCLHNFQIYIQYVALAARIALWFDLILHILLQIG